MSQTPREDSAPGLLPSRLQEMPQAVVIEDEPSIRKVIEEILATFNYPVASFESAEAFRRARLDDQPRVFIVDKNLPGISGLQLLERLRSSGQEFESIVITGYADMESAIKAVRLGCYSYVTKPFDLDDFVKDVNGATHRLQARRAVTTTALPEHQRQLSELRSVLARMIHDINTPLTTIVADLACLAEPSLEITDRDTAIHEMRESVDRLRRVANSISAAACFTPTEDSLIDGRLLIEAAISVAKSRTRYRGHIVRHFDELPQLELNRTLFEMLLLICIVEPMELHQQEQDSQVSLRAAVEDRRFILEISTRDRPGSHRRPSASLSSPAMQIEEFKDSLELMICRSLARAVGGELAVDRAREGALSIKLTLPCASASR